MDVEEKEEEEEVAQQVTQRGRKGDVPWNCSGFSISLPLLASGGKEEERSKGEGQREKGYAR